MISIQKRERPVGPIFRIVCLSSVVALLLLLSCASAQTPAKAVTAERAWAIAKEKVLHNELEGKAVFVSPRPLKAGDIIKAMVHEYRVPEKFGSAWLVYIDDAPNANLEHPSRYVFVSATSEEYEVLKATAPPDDLDSYSKVYPKQ